MINKKDDGTQFLWCSFNKIKELYKNNKINLDQFRIIKRAEERNHKKSNNAMKVNHKDLKYEKLAERDNFGDYVDKFTDKRLFLRLVWGRSVKPCGRECREYGYLIANEFSNHTSFKNFPTLMDDEEFLLEIAKTSRNPATCSIYFYDYINPYLKKDKEFRLAFLKQIYFQQF